jgi:hypothetical protein
LLGKADYKKKKKTGKQKTNNSSNWRNKISAVPGPRMIRTYHYSKKNNAPWINWNPELKWPEWTVLLFTRGVKGGMGLSVYKTGLN